jgi:hypothetical protein
MKTSLISPALAILVLIGAAGCSSPASRISRNEAAFAQWPAAVQEKVRAGKIDVGFTQEQTRVALGAPVRIFTRTTAEGTGEVWAYADNRPSFSFGLGIGSVRGNTGTSVGLGYSDRDWRDGERMRVVFDREGKVTTIESGRGRM